jgi:phosphatidylglycerophosphatase A
VGTLWAWAAFLVLDGWLNAAQWGVVIAASLVVGWWACTRTAQHLRVADPGCHRVGRSRRVLDRAVAAEPGTLVGAGVAFALFRFFDAAKPGPGGLGRPLVQAAAGAGHRLGAGRRHPVRRPGGSLLHPVLDRLWMRLWNW